MPTNKFTFKTTKPTGRYMSFEKAYHEIKLKKVNVGSIHETFEFNPTYTISLQVIKKDIMEDGNKNCLWKHIYLKKKFNSLQEAKDFLNNNIEAILKQFTLVRE